MKELTKHEKYLFGLTGSNACTVLAQRTAIAREGLTGMTRKDIERVRREKWRIARQNNTNVPTWVLALQRSQYRDWRFGLPRGVEAGELRNCWSVRIEAYQAVDWGRLRKREYGSNSPYGAGVSEETNGKGGWDRVVWRYANYGCVLSPDGKKVAYSIKPAQWVVSACFRGRFFCEGVPARLNEKEKSGYRVRLRDCLRLLKNAGFTAYLTRQTRKQIVDGSGERGREGELVLIVDFGKLGFYHADASPHVVAVVRDALERREQIRDQAELEAIVSRGEAAGVYVCASDSYRAGNCRPGTESFAQEHNLDLGRHYTAGELLAISNGNTRFVRAAVISALRRERREVAAGECLLSDHRA